MDMKENEIAKIIDLCISEISAGSATENDCFLRYPEIENELRTAFSVNQQFQSAESIALNAKSRAALKKTILFNLPDRENLVTKQNGLRYRWQNTKRRFAMTWLIIVTTVLSLLSGAGAVYASNDALPGEFLYPLKTWTEDVQLLLAPDNVDVELAGIFTSRRMDELLELLQSGEEIDLDDLLGGYRNRTEMMARAFEKVRTQNPEEAINLRIELETRLHEQARIMEILLAENESSLERPLQMQIRTMLQSNLQTRLRISQDVPVEDPVEDPSEEQTEEAEDENKDQNQFENQNRNRVENVSDEILENNSLVFRFRFSNSLVNGVYAEVGGKVYACSAQGNLVTCDLTGTAGKGTVRLYDLKTKQLLYSYTYEHNYEYLWSGTKEGGSGNQQQGNPDSGGGSGDNGKSGGTK
jgi:hypothetical protein